MPFAAIVATFGGGFLVLVAIHTRWASSWGSTPEERAREMPGDRFFTDLSAARTVMTRAVDIAAPPELVWPWLAQLGRGAGFYSFDALDNGRRTSARHIVSWIPEPTLGDATTIGFVRDLTPGRSVTWWVPGVRFLGALARLTTDIDLRPAPSGSRLVIRMSADARGTTAHFAIALFRVIDSIMARKQLTNIRDRAERHGARKADPQHPETDARDQYQLYEVVYVTGESAGVKGQADGSRWHDHWVRASSDETSS